MVSSERAEQYARVVAPTLLGVARRAVAASGIEAAGSLLDAGANTGLAAFLAATVVGPDGSVVAIDPDEAFLAVGEARATAAGYRAIRWQAMALGVLPYAHESFDASVSVHAMDLMVDPVLLIEELRRVTVEGGAVVVANWGAPRENEWIGAVERAVGRAGGPTLPRAAVVAEPGNLEALMQAAGLGEVEGVRFGDPLRVQGIDGLWQWVAGLRPWADVLARLDDDVRMRAKDRLAREFEGRTRGGELAIGREMTLVRATVPPS
jgi:SAM-dependent methyltransferase